jgi:7-carboxy-7-deazaguanine synthase
MLQLSEHFLSIQGEGLLTGYPSIFFRFGGCNLQCRGFGVEYSISGESRVGCDSFYAVDREFANEWRDIESEDTLSSIIEEYPQNIRDIVITGGEPLIYSKNPLFLKFLNYLQERRYRITIETNGTIPVENIEQFKDILFAVSLKLSNSGEDFNSRFNLNAIHSFTANSEHLFFKFTIDEKYMRIDRGNEIKKISKLFPNIPIYCMPIASTREEIESICEKVALFCIENNFIYSDRVQIRLWNNKRGI